MKRSLLIAWLAALSWTLALRADDFQSGDVKIHYIVQGSGTPVVLIHGLLSSAQMNWTLPGITAAVAKHHQVIALDCRGHGSSDKPLEESAYGPPMAEDVVALLDHLGIRKAHIVGYSMGGMIALKLAVLHPERIESVMLCGMGWLPEGSKLQDFWTAMPVKDDAGRASYVTACMKGMGHLAVTESAVKSLNMPAAIVIGEKDPVEKLYVEPLKQIRPDWPVTTIPGAGHIVCVVKPEFREAVVKILDGFDAKH
jgi:pimeloyl-ACP methyl ester carboxylesterase